MTNLPVFFPPSKFHAINYSILQAWGYGTQNHQYKNPAKMVFGQIVKFDSTVILCIVSGMDKWKSCRLISMITVKWENLEGGKKALVNGLRVQPKH